MLPAVGRDGWTGPARCYGLLLWLVIAALLGSTRSEAAPRVVVLLSESAPAYREVADAFATALDGRHPVETRSLTGMRADELAALRSDRNLLVPVGLPAARAVQDAGGGPAAILNLLVPQASVAPPGGSAVYLDQPFGRPLALARLLLPPARRVGIIVSDAPAAQLDGYAAEARQAGLELVTERVADRQGLAGALRRLLPRIDVLLLVPDVAVIDALSVRPILIASYRHKIPVVGFSRGLVEAGVVASVYASTAAIGRAGGRLARQWNPATGALPAARPAASFELDFNHAVARSLGIAIPVDAAELAAWRERLQDSAGHRVAAVDDGLAQGLRLD